MPTYFLTYHLDGIYLQDQMGCMPLKDEFDEIMLELDDLLEYYSTITDDYIRNQNAKCHPYIAEVYKFQGYTIDISEENPAPMELCFPDGTTRKIYFNNVKTETNKNTSGWIYFIGGHENWYKIGVTRRNPVQLRVHEIAKSLPFQPVLEFYFYSDDPYQTEKELHARFERQKINGEWFKLDEATIKELKQTMGDKHE